MVSALDVAQYILEKTGRISAIKLQKLVYYSQAWHLVWTERPLFDDEIQAWANGPVIPALYVHHKGMVYVDCIPGGDPSRLDEEERDSVDRVVAYYGDKPAWWLVECTHVEEPWRNARNGVPLGQRCENVISHADMIEYYAGLLQ